MRARYNHWFWNSRLMNWFCGRLIKLENYIWFKMYGGDVDL